jgi:hypothetical protein
MFKFFVLNADLMKKENGNLLQLGIPFLTKYRPSFSCHRVAWGSILYYYNSHICRSAMTSHDLLLKPMVSKDWAVSGSVTYTAKKWCLFSHFNAAGTQL